MRAGFPVVEMPVPSSLCRLWLQPPSPPRSPSTLNPRQFVRVILGAATSRLLKTKRRRRSVPVGAASCHSRRRGAGCGRRAPPGQQQAEAGQLPSRPHPPRAATFTTCSPFSLQPPLVQAIFNRDVEEVRSLLNQKENINVLVSAARPCCLCFTALLHPAASPRPSPGGTVLPPDGRARAAQGRLAPCRGGLFLQGWSEPGLRSKDFTFCCLPGCRLLCSFVPLPRSCHLYDGLCGRTALPYFPRRPQEHPEAFCSAEHCWEAVWGVWEGSVEAQPCHAASLHFSPLGQQPQIVRRGCRSSASR